MGRRPDNSINQVELEQRETSKLDRRNTSSYWTIINIEEDSVRKIQ